MLNHSALRENGEMSTVYGINPTIVTYSIVNAVYLVGSTILSQSEDNGGYTITVRHDTGSSCESTGVFVQLKDTIPWTKISAEFWTTGSAACWTYMQPGGYGSSSGDGNIATYDESSGDRCIRTFLAQDDAQFSSHAKANACDNDANNFMRYNTTVFRKCAFVRRRIVNGNLGGVHHGRACNEVGSNAITIIKNIRIWT
jgi:hypothetical protein